MAIHLLLFFPQSDKGANSTAIFTLIQSRLIKIKNPVCKIHLWKLYAYSYEYTSQAFTIPNNLKKFIHKGKDRLDHFSKQGIVYKIECLDCEANYIDQTKKRLQTRINEYLILTRE